jgi:hypothetical protein
VATGAGALAGNTLGSNSVAIGYCALSAGISPNNTAVGACAGCSISGGYQNVVVGGQALCSGVTTQQSVAVGWAALGQATSDFNTAVGFGAGGAITTGGGNTLLGINAANVGTTLTSGNQNVLIGNQVTPSAGNVSNEVSIWNGSVTARFQGAAGSWSFVSDERDKTNITALPLGLEFVKALEPRKFAWDLRSSEVDKGKEAAGFIAQEVLAVTEQFDAPYTGLVDTNDPNQYTFAAGALLPMVVNAVKELAASHEALSASHDALVAENADLKARVEVLEGGASA